MNYAPDDTDFPNSTCMLCFQHCETWEIIYTGDEDAYAGFEVWAYCRECDIETFHTCTQKPKP